MPAPHQSQGVTSSVTLLHDGHPVATGDSAITEAARLLGAGEVVAIPTDTVYGLAAALDAPDAMTEIFRIKRRAPDQTLPVLIDDILTVSRLTADASSLSRNRSIDRLLRLAGQHWPGGLTVAIPARPGLAITIVAADGTIGLRIPDHAVARHLIGLAGGALAVTSANRSGHPPATGADAIARQFGEGGDRPRWALDGGPATGGQASTVIGCMGDELVIHRVGAVDPGVLQRAWASLREVEAGPAG